MDRRERKAATEGVPGWERRFLAAAKRIGILLLILVGLMVIPIVINLVVSMTPQGRERAAQSLRQIRLDNSMVQIYSPEWVYYGSRVGDDGLINCLSVVGGALEGYVGFQASDYTESECRPLRKQRVLPEALRAPLSELLQLKYVLGMGAARFVDLDDDGLVDCIGPSRAPELFVFAAEGASCGEQTEPLANDVRRQASQAMALEARILDLIREHGVDQPE